MRVLKIIYIYPKKASFITTDLNILSQKYNVIENTGNWDEGYKIPFLFVKQLFFLLKKVKKTECFVVSFGGYWALLPVIIAKLFKKKVFIILHGTDCADFKEINYGNLRKPYLKAILGVSYKLATRLLPVSSSLIYTENSYFSKDKIIKQGIDVFFPNINTPKTVISNVFDGNKWKIEQGAYRYKNRFITVLGNGQFKRKGGDLILKVARKLTQFDFYFTGIDVFLHQDKMPDNVFFTGKATPEKLCKLYNESAYYLQLSIFEGFGCALCEAMLCGCIPIVSSVNVLPEIVGDTGYILEKMDEDLLILLLTQVYLNNNEELRIKARNRILEKYPIELRKKNIYEVLKTT